MQPYPPPAVVTDRLAARLRTLIPAIIGHLAALLLIHGAPVLDVVEKVTGYRPTGAELAVALGLALSYGVYELGRRLEAVRGDRGAAAFARGVGRILLSLGVPTGPPTYQR